MYKTIEKHTTNDRNCIPIDGGDSNAELWPECTSVGNHTLNGGNKSGEKLKQKKNRRDKTEKDTGVSSKKDTKRSLKKIKKKLKSKTKN